MKAKITSVVLLIFITQTLWAQEFSAGVSGGLVISQVDGDSFGGYNRFGPVGGLFVCNTFGEQWGGRMELKYIQKGSLATNYANSNTIGGYYKMNLHYIEIPFLAEYRIQQFKIPPKIDWEFNNRLSLLAGPYLSYLFKASEDGDGNGANNSLDSFRKIELGGQIGFCWFLGENLAFDYRFSYTFLPIRDLPPSSNLDYWVRWEFNRVMTFSLMYQF